jgi:hypothetical protein
MFDNRRKFKRSPTNVLVKYRKVEDIDKRTNTDNRQIANPASRF